jgi:hypothetical protein
MIVLELDQQKMEAGKNLLQHPTYSKFMVLDAGHLKFHEDKERFRMAIEILNTCNFFVMVNEFLKGSSSKKEFKTGILYQAMQHVLKEEPFNDAQLKEYFLFWQEFESLTKLILKLYDTDSFLLDYQVDYILFGCSYSNQFDAKKANLMDDVNDKYGEINCEVRFKNIEIDAFIKKVKEILKPLNEQQGRLSA